MAADSRKETRWVRAVPVLLVVVAVVTVVAWKWGPFRSTTDGTAPATESPGLPAGEPEPLPADAGSADAEVTGRLRQEWSAATGSTPRWPEDLADPLDCDSVQAELEALCRGLDGRDYLRRFDLGEGSRDLIAGAATALGLHPPVATGERRRLELLLGNAFHLFRVLGRDRLTVLREMERREQSLAEPAGLALFRWVVSREKCGEGDQPSLSGSVLYDYSAYLLGSIGGQAYLRRRSPRVEGLATFYALVIADRLIEEGHDPLGLDLRRDIRRCRQLLAGQELVFRDRYLAMLDEMDHRWQAR